MRSWIITVEEDPETGDLVLPFPDDLLKEAGWKPGDTLEWNVVENDGNGNWASTLKLKKKDGTDE